VLLEQVIDTDYGQFDLTWNEEGGFDGEFERYFAGQANGLVGAADPSGVYLNLARRSGGSPVRVVLSDAPPDVDDSWEDVVEVSSTVPADAEPRWMSWAGEDSGPLDGLSSGTYRVRVSARGRDAGRDGEFAEETVDFYLVELWPAPESPDAIVKVGSEDARYWHREIGQRR
jgi:hypothetical protein